MAIIAEIDRLEQIVIEKSCLTWEDVKICELGNQYNSVYKKAAKKIYMERNVVEHISIDLNGKDGSIKLDLCKPITEDLVGRFNVVTNYGTTEHVDNQYQVFKNINDACCINGIMIHALIPPKNWIKHGKYHYPMKFVEDISIRCEYSIDLLEIIHRKKKNLIFVVYRKQKNGFITNSEFKKIPIVK